MHPNLRVLVALDLTEMDDQLIQYSSLLSQLLPIERIFFIHVAKNLELPPDLIEKYPDLMAPLDESLETDIQKKIDQSFQGRGVDTSCMIREGNPIEKILKVAKVKHVDLILMGRKPSLEGSGLISSHIARKCPCSLLLVTQKFNPPRRILVPLDFSDHSLLAMKEALTLAKSSGAEVMPVHIYSVPTGFYKTGKSLEEFSEIMKGHAEKDYQRFLSKHELGVDFPCTYILADDGKHASQLYDYARGSEVDLIVIGSKGRTPVSAILMGSMAEKLVYKDSDIPILIVKNKGENMGFLETLMRI